MNASYFFLGSATVYADRENALPLLNLCMFLALPYSDFVAEEEGGVTLTIRHASLPRLVKEANARGISLSVKKRGGLPNLLFTHRRRYGLALGAVCAVLLVFFANNFLWDIRVKGNTTLTCAEIIELLEKYELSVGSRIKGINTDKLENQILQDEPSLSWISINLIGNVAEIEVIEAKTGQGQYVGTNPANVIAKKGGVIEYLMLYRGNAVVMAGQNVGEGELLISGIFDSGFDGFRFTRADGEVMARTVSEYFVEVEYDCEEKAYSEKIKYDQYLNFFGRSVKLFKNYGNLGQMYDTIIMERNVSFPDGVTLPLGISRVIYSEYEIRPSRRTQEEAERLAYFELSEQIYADVGDAQIIKKTVTPTITDDGIRLHCVLVCIENIAEVREFEVDLSRMPEG